MFFLELSILIMNANDLSFNATASNSNLKWKTQASCLQQLNLIETTISKKLSSWMPLLSYCWNAIYKGKWHALYEIQKQNEFAHILWKKKLKLLNIKWNINEKKTTRAVKRNYWIVKIPQVFYIQITQSAVWKANSHKSNPITTAQTIGKHSFPSHVSADWYSVDVWIS